MNEIRSAVFEELICSFILYLGGHEFLFQHLILLASLNNVSTESLR